MASSGSPGDGYIVNGWQRFFVELSVFLSTADRQISTANQAYSEYVLERLQMALASMNSILHHLNSDTIRRGSGRSDNTHYLIIKTHLTSQ